MKADTGKKRTSSRESEPKAARRRATGPNVAEQLALLRVDVKTLCRTVDEYSAILDAKNTELLREMVILRERLAEQLTHNRRLIDEKAELVEMNRQQAAKLRERICSEDPTTAPIQALNLTLLESPEGKNWPHAGEART